MKPLCKICNKKIEGSISFPEEKDFQPCHFECNIQLPYKNNEEDNKKEDNQ